ncbi:MAG: putative sulfate exporter family transporter [Candidatus Baltobacteraceae bacterium]
MNKLPGVALCAAIAVVAYWLGRALPIVGGPVFGVVLGMLVALIRKPTLRLDAGIKFSSKQVLQYSIVGLGTNLRLGEIVGSGLRSLPVMLGTLVITLSAAYFIGKWLGIERDLRRLLGIGTAICGGSAIAALSTVIMAGEADIAYAISTVFLFNIVAVLLFPALGHVLALSQQGFGLWAGTAINDTSSVVAAAFVYGHTAGNEAVIVKLTRTTLIVPIVLYYAWKTIERARSAETPVEWTSIMPWFIVWFVIAALLNTFGLIPAAWHPALTAIALFLIVVALTGVGLSADFAKMREAGAKPLLLGLILWVLIAVSSLGIANLAHIG